MKITNRQILTSFARKHADTINPINKWIQVVESHDFRNHNELKEVFPAADYVGKERYVFNIKGKRYRFVVMAMFISGLMEVRFCGTHAEYDKIKNIEDL